MKTVIQIKEYGSKKVVHEVDVSGHSERSRERVEMGMNRNLNHAKYYTMEAEIEDRELINWQNQNQ